MREGDSLKPGLDQYVEVMARFGLVLPRLLQHVTSQQGRALPAGVGRAPARQCYQNAGLLVVQNPTLTYCEGFAVSRVGVPVQHAWCLDAQGQVVDPTWPDTEQAWYRGLPYRTELCHEHWQSTQVWDLWSEIPSQTLMRPGLLAQDVFELRWVEDPEGLCQAWAELVTAALPLKSNKPRTSRLVEKRNQLRKN